MPESSAAVPAPNSTPSDAVLYNEKLWPNAWIWLVSAGLSGAGILVFAPISLAAGLTAAVVLFVIIAVLLVLSTPAITVTGSTLRVGRATIERRFVGSASAFRGAEATAAMGGGLDIVSYLGVHGVQARWQREAVEPQNLGELLLSRAFDLQADLLVMGCYGRARAYEWVLGGASRTVLKSMTLPVLMAH